MWSQWHKEAQRDFFLTDPLDAVKETPASGRGRRNRLPHHLKHWPAIGGGGGFARRFRLRIESISQLLSERYFTQGKYRKFSARNAPTASANRTAKPVRFTLTLPMEIPIT